MRLYFGIFAATILWIGAAHAAPGDYAKNSAKYREFIANCRYDVVGKPELKDQAAKKLEGMSKEQFDLQVRSCQEAQERAQLASQASAPLAPIAAAHEPVPAQQTQEPEADEAPQATVQEARLGQDDLSQLERIAKRALGPVPMDATGYRAVVLRRVGPPAPGCVQVRQVHPGKGTMVRWRCPKGTVQRLGH